MNSPDQEDAQWLRDSRIARITRDLYQRKNFGYFCVDLNWKVLEVSENLTSFGFSELALGADASDSVDFLVGVDIEQVLDLPMLSSPSKLPIRVSLLPRRKELTVVIMDASEEFQQRRQLQQKANENQLLLDKQAKLMTELESAQNQLQEQNSALQEAARLQSSFLSGVSHEFRTPLTSIIGYNELLRTQWDKLSKKSALNHITAVQRSSKHLLSLVENLLDHGKYQSQNIELHPKPSNIDELFNDVVAVVAPAAHTKNIDLLTEFDFSGTKMVLVDDSRLRQCLINTIGNAIKFTDEGSVRVTASWADDEIKVEIVDTGIGISSEHLQKIRQPFWQVPDTGKAGTGLGLTITERIIEMMGGSFSIDSNLGDGTKLSFEVMAAGLAENILQQTAAQVPATEALKILFAEDDEDIAALTILLLEEQGVSVTHVENGLDAIKKLEVADYDLVLMDLNMPVMDGYTAVEKIRRSGNAVPIMVMTASSTRADKERVQALGCDGYLVKPVDIMDLLSLASHLTNTS